MYRAFPILFVALLLLLAACGAPAPTPKPKPPSALVVTPMVALPGQAIVVTGDDLGETGTLLLGGVELNVTDWTDTRVEATLADGTPGAYQELELRTDVGSAFSPEFFVGAAFGGEAAELPDFLDGLDKGVAVLLQAKTYTFSVDLELDNRSLYGRGIGETAVNLGTHTFAILVDYGQDVTVADMSIAADQVVHVVGSLSAARASAALGAVDGSYSAARAIAPDARRGFDLASIRADALAGLTLPESTRARLAEASASSAPTLRPTGIASSPLRAAVAAALQSGAMSSDRMTATSSAPRLRFNNLHVSEVTGGSFGTMFGGVVPASDISLTGVEFDGPNSFFQVLTRGAFVVEGSTITGQGVFVGSMSGAAAVVDSTLTATDMLIGAETGIRIEGSTLTTEDGNIEILGALLSEFATVPVPTGGPIDVTGSTIESLDGDLDDVTMTGALILHTAVAPITIRDSSTLRAHQDVTIVTQFGAFGEADLSVRDSVLRAGLFKSEVSNPAHARTSYITLVTQGQPGNMTSDTLTLERNLIEATGGVQVMSGDEDGASSAKGRTHLIDNIVTSGDGDHTGVFILVGGVHDAMDIQGNTFTADGVSQIVAPDSAGSGVSFVDNTFDLIGDNGPVLLMVLQGGDRCEFGQNRVRVTDTSGDQASNMIFVCQVIDPSSPVDWSDNDVAVAGDGTSSVQVVFDGGTARAAGNVLANEQGLLLMLADVTATVSDNDLDLGSQGLYVQGNAGTVVTVEGNRVTTAAIGGPSAFYALQLGSTTLVDNTFVNAGVAAADTPALRLETAGIPSTLVATGNSFANYARALRFEDDAGAAVGIDATVNDNVFDFVIDAAPKAAELVNVKDAIDATRNTWGTNNSAATVAGYVSLSGDTAIQGGSITVAPITVP